MGGLVNMEKWREDILVHYGVLGMKWGVRRYQNDDGSYTDAGIKRYGVGSKNKTGKQMANRLNDLDWAMTRHKRHLLESNRTISKLTKKAAKKQARGKDLSDRQKSKLSNARKEKTRSTKAIKQGTSEVNSIISKAEKSGYSVKSKRTVRSVAEGRDILPNVLKSVAMTTAATAIMLPTAGYSATILSTGPYAEGTRYKVKKKKE